MYLLCWQNTSYADDTCTQSLSGLTAAPRHCTSTAKRPEENWPLLSQGQVNQASGAVPGVSGGGERRDGSDGSSSLVSSTE